MLLESTRSTLNRNVKTTIFVHIYQYIVEIVYEKVERNRLMYTSLNNEYEWHIAQI